MTTEIDNYLATLDARHRATLQIVRERIAALIPDAEEGISYGAPVFRLAGRPIAGFSASKHHLSYLPHSGSVLSEVEPHELLGFSASKGAVKMPLDTPLPTELLERLIALRRAEAGV